MALESTFLTKRRFAMFVRKFQFSLCGDWIEIYEQVPNPEDGGAFFLAFRKKFGRKVLPFLCGLTASGANLLAESFKTPGHECLTQVCLLIGEKLKGRFTELVPLSVP